MILLDLFNRLSGAASGIERTTTIFFGVVIFLQLVFLMLTFFRKTILLHTIARYAAVFPIGFAILCFQHEVGHYAQGTSMLLLALAGIGLSFRKSVD